MNRKFHTALTALIAACSVAVVVAPGASAQGAPPWPAQPAPCVLPPLAGPLTPTNPLSARLSIRPVFEGYEVVVSGVVRASSVAEAYRLYKGWRAEYTLWGEDPDGDDRLGPGGHVRRGYMVQGDECEGRVGFSESRYYRNASAYGHGYLDEDSYPTDGDATSLANRDEIYAEVRYKDYRVRTNTVYGFFGS